MGMLMKYGLFFVLFFSNLAFADDLHSSLLLRSKIQKSDFSLLIAVESFKMPVSRPTHQKDSQLCWVYSFLNAIETIHLVKNPESKLTFSRSYLQEKTMQDRIERKLSGLQDYLSERGTPVYAYALAQKFGLMNFDDVKDIIPAAEDHYPDIFKKVLKGAPLQKELDTLFGDMPLTTHDDHGNLSPVDLGSEILKDMTWVSYSPVKAGQKEGIATHPDPDARKGTMSLYTTMTKIKSVIHDALKSNRPIAYSANGHVVLIYGGDYDEKGEATKFLIKDSYPGYFYDANPKKVYRDMLEIALAK
jgi:hypothetical protein